MKEFVTIKQEVQTELVEKKSKFIVYLFPVESSMDAEEKIKEIRKKYFDARHHCFAYRILEDGQLIERSSDDGEPSGTAGAPMLNILQKNELVNVLIVVIRYFGGILLGTGGLVRAYSNGLLQAIKESELIKKCLGQEIEIILSYQELENFKYYCKINQINIQKIEYQENIVCRVEVEERKKQKLVDDFETKKMNFIELNELNKKYIMKSI